MNISKFLSKVIGIYLIIVSMAMLVNMHQFVICIRALINDMPLMFICGFFTLIPGILMVLSHNIWEWSWRVIITIISWMVLLKGAGIIMYPLYVNKLSLLFVQNINVIYIVALSDFAVGIILSYFGFKVCND